MYRFLLCLQGLPRSSVLGLLKIWLYCRGAITERGNSLQGGALCCRCGTNKNKHRFSLLLSGWASEQLEWGKLP